MDTSGLSRGLNLHSIKTWMAFLGLNQFLAMHETDLDDTLYHTGCNFTVNNIKVHVHVHVIRHQMHR